MACSLRIEYKNATDHVLARGNRREAIFRDDRDRTEFLRRLEIVCGRMGWSILGYVLIGNHPRGRITLRNRRW
jgi:putative transposase